MCRLTKFWLSKQKGLLVHSSLQKDIVTLNRRYLLLIKQMAAEKHPLLPASTPKSLIKNVQNMTLEEIDQLSEDMIAPCFYMNIGEAVFNQMEEQKSGAHRKAYMANVLVTQLQEDGKR